MADESENGQVSKNQSEPITAVGGSVHQRESIEPESIEAANQSENIQKKTHRLDSITVVADMPRKDLDPDSITNPYRVETSARFGTEVFTEKEIQNLKPSDVYDLLDKATGINLTYQGRKSPFFISLRGGGSFTYIIDGAVLPSSVNRILYKFPVAAIEQMQIVRGSTSLTLGPSIGIGASNSGSGLNTGFIIIRTKQPGKTQAILSGSIEKAKGGHPIETQESVYVGSLYDESSQIEGYLGGMLSKTDRPSQDSWFDGREGSGGMLNTGIKAGKFNLNMMVYRDSGYFEMQRGVAADGTLSDVKWYYDPLETTIYSGDMGIRWDNNNTTLLNLFKVQYDQTERNESFSSSAVTIKEYEEETSGIGLRHNSCFYNTLLQLGGQMSNSKGYGPNLSKGYNKYDTTVIGWSASVEQKLLNDNLVFNLGYRRDVKHIDNSSAARNESQATNEANNDVDMAPANIYALGAHWQLTDIYALDTRYYYGDQGTSGDFDVRTENGEELHGEKQKRIEIGLAADFTSWLRATLTWFDIDIKNAKSATNSTYELDSGTYYYYSEADELRRGFEIMVQGKIMKNTIYKLSWTRILDNESTSGGVTTDENGVSNPENLYSLMLNHCWNSYKFNLSVKKVDEWSTSSSPMGTASYGGLGGYTRVDANIKRDFKISDRLVTITLYGRNLGDKHYSTRYVTGYYPDRGRTIGTQLTLAF
ncbi:MAG: TonB-dependent receptor plug domain-containing protein [Proteobacteria bacterium]|nr:TonB-dependent receptor plug domain-containing protein [Pseudomonadota bacterium]